MSLMRPATLATPTPGCYPRSRARSLTRPGCCAIGRRPRTSSTTVTVGCCGRRMCTTCRRTGRGCCSGRSRTPASTPRAPRAGRVVRPVERRRRAVGGFRGPVGGGAVETVGAPRVATGHRAGAGRAAADAAGGDRTQEHGAFTPGDRRGTGRDAEPRGGPDPPGARGASVADREVHWRVKPVWWEAEANEYE